MKKNVFFTLLILLGIVGAGARAYSMAAITFSKHIMTFEKNGDNQVIEVSLAEPLISASGTAIATISFSNTDSRISVQPNQLVFTGSNWWQHQSITVTKIANATSGGNNTITVPILTTSNSEFYDKYKDALEVTLVGTADPSGIPATGSSGRRIPQTVVWWNQGKDVSVVNALFTKELSLGVWDDQVRKLQQFLNNHQALVSKNGIGSPGKESYFFGIKTKNALKQYQSAHGLLETGILDESTRILINNVLSQHN